MYVPWTGLGLFGGFRGNRWLKNRVKVFKQFVIPSLQAQTNKNFILWCSWRPEEKHNSHVKELIGYLEGIKEFDSVHTFHGVCFYDDKFKPVEARDRLLTALHGSLGELINVTTEDTVLMTIQPSDDCYNRHTVEFLQRAFSGNEFDCIGFKHGYMMNYLTKELSEYNPKTNPPFYTIRFPRALFIDPFKHAEFTALKQDIDQYKAGTPLPSHEYPKYVFGKRYGVIDQRGFLVGCHGENISTTYVHPYKGEQVDKEVLKDFGIYDTEPLKIRTSIRRAILRRLPHKIQRKLRYYLGEKIWQRGYEFLRG